MKDHDETDRRNYAKNKMADLRQVFKLAGIKQVGGNFPDQYAKYITALCNLLTGVHLIELVEDEDNEDIREAFANMKPTGGPSIEELDMLYEVHGENSKHGPEIKRIEAFMRAARMERVEFKNAMEEGNYNAACYHGAREYAYITYARGAYQMLVYLIGGGVVPDISLEAPKRKTQE